MKVNNFSLPIINDDKIFENFCLDYFKIKFRDPSIQLNGRSGQKQNGVDIFCHINFPYEWIGIQCKVKSTSTKISLSEVKTEIERAKQFNPKLSQYIIVTTGSRDAILQEQIRILNDEFSSLNIFYTQIVFWEDILEELSN